MQANLDLERFEEAEHDASVALRHDPDNLKARYRRARARAHKRERDTRGACADLVKIVASDPKQKEARLYMRHGWQRFSEQIFFLVIAQSTALASELYSACVVLYPRLVCECDFGDITAVIRFKPCIWMNC